MSKPRLFDAVSLRHLATVGALELLPRVCELCGPPRWVEAVQDEIQRFPTDEACRVVNAFEWLGEPEDPLATELPAVFRLQRVMNGYRDEPTRNLGEAMSIVIGRRLDATFVTDDAGAYRMAQSPEGLGPGRVSHTCRILHEAMGEGFMSRGQVRRAHETAVQAKRVLLCTQKGFSCG